MNTPTKSAARIGNPMTAREMTDDLDHDADTGSIITVASSFIMLPTGVMNAAISDRALRTYLCLRSYARPGHATFPKMVTVAEKFGVSESYLRRGIAELSASGLLVIHKRHLANGFRRVNEYHFPDVAEDGTARTDRPGKSDMPGHGKSDMPGHVRMETGPGIANLTCRKKKMKQEEEKREGGCASDVAASPPPVAETPPPNASKTQPTTPTPRAHPEQCDKHQDGPHTDSCRACGKAREAHAAAVAAAAAAEREGRERLDRHRPVDPPSILADQPTAAAGIAWRREVNRQIRAGATVTDRIAEQLARQIVEQNGTKAA